MSQQGPCTTEPALWFSSDRADEQQAKQLCSTCPYRGACLDDTLEYERLSGDIRSGIFGGLTPRERIRLHATRA